MKSTGEVMGSGRTFAEAFSKSSLAAGMPLPATGKVLMSVRDADKPAAVRLAEVFHRGGFDIVATAGTQSAIASAGVPCEAINKVAQGRPHVVDIIKNDELTLIVNTTDGRQAISDSFLIRREALNHRMAYATTMAAAEAIGAVVSSVTDEKSSATGVYRLDEIHEESI